MNNNYTYVFKTRLHTGRETNKQYDNSKKAARYFKNHMDCDMQICIYDKEHNKIACYRFNNGIISNVDNFFMIERCYNRQFDLKDDCYYVAMINDDLTIHYEQFKSVLLAEMYYEENKGVKFATAIHYAKSVDYDRKREYIANACHDYDAQDVYNESTIVIDKNTKDIIEVYFFNEKYNTEQNKKEVLKMYYGYTFNTNINNDTDFDTRYFYSKQLNKKCKIEKLISARDAERCFNKGCYIWIFPKWVSIGSGVECRIGGPNSKYLSGGKTFTEMVQGFRESIAGLKDNELVFYLEII